ncbi:hypothetical protein NT98_1406 [Bacillus cereus]|nr:Hypothetical Protein H9401_5679 [Bacillus anthracis str. H9401]AHK41829.1 hypothetical protein BAPAT_pXO10211 [Bacillus anthracis str. SVA11]AIY77826.1 hypothetical protein NT98_1406 [Bacillus cereus]EDV13383.1 hypothetical protein BATI_B0217 [Bacillus anthracis str. Tsiankovskii-I]
MKKAWRQYARIVRNIHSKNYIMIIQNGYSFAYVAIIEK